MKEQVRAALQRWRGTQPNLVEVLDTFIDDDVDLSFEFDTQARGVALDAHVWHRE